MVHTMSPSDDDVDLSLSLSLYINISVYVGYSSETGDTSFNFPWGTDA